MSSVKIIGKHQSPFGAMRVGFVSNLEGDAGFLDVAQQYLRAMALYNNFETRHYLKAIINQHYVSNTIKQHGLTAFVVPFELHNK